MDGEHILVFGGSLVVGCGLGVSVAGEMGGVGGWMGIGAPTKGVGRYL